MKRSLLALTLLLSLSTAQAEILESSITIQLKLLDQNPPPDNDNFTVQSFTTTSYKTSDFIQLVAKGENFSKSARLIYQSTYGGGGKIIIRDKGREDFLVTGGLTSAFPVRIGGGGENIVLKGKRNTENNTNAFKHFGQYLFRLGTPTESKIQIKGTLNMDRSIIQSKDDPTKILSPLSLTLTGIGSFDLTSEDLGLGFAQGTIKYSKPKVIRDK